MHSWLFDMLVPGGGITIESPSPTETWPVQALGGGGGTLAHEAQHVCGYPASASVPHALPSTTPWQVRPATPKRAAAWASSSVHSASADGSAAGAVVHEAQQVAG